MSSTPPPPGLNALASAATSRSSASSRSRTSLLLAQTDSDEEFEKDFNDHNGTTEDSAAAAPATADEEIEVLEDPVLSAMLVDVELVGEREELLRVAKKGKELSIPRSKALLASPWCRSVELL